MDEVAEWYARVYQDAAKRVLQDERRNKVDELLGLEASDTKALAERVLDLIISLAKIHVDMMGVLEKAEINTSDSREGVRLDILAETTVGEFYNTIADLYVVLGRNPEEEDNGSTEVLMVRTVLLQKLLACRIPQVREAQDATTERSAKLELLRSKPVVELYAKMAKIDGWEKNFGPIDRDDTTSDSDVAQKSAKAISKDQADLLSFFEKGLMVTDSELETIQELDRQALATTVVFSDALASLQRDPASASISSRIDRYNQAQLPRRTILHHALVTEVYDVEARARKRAAASLSVATSGSLGGRKALQQRGYNWCSF